MSTDQDSQEVTVLPDGSAFVVSSMPLPADHWLLLPGPNEPPVPFRMGVSNPVRGAATQAVREAAQYALRAATLNGTEEPDPDAVIQNLIVGLFGYHTEDGHRGDL